ncbi:MAG: AAA family ATPase [Planctomycetes bacterium]|nr:AAA family ATPase [Planctomycetota bacterium]
MDLTLEQRLLRFLAREEHDEHRAYRELLAQPVEQRVLDGECLHGVRFIGHDAGTWSFYLADNGSKFRAGDTVAVGDGLDLDAAVPFVYAGYDARTGELRLERDPYVKDLDCWLEDGETYVIDRRPLGLRGRLRDIVRAAFGERALAAVLTGQHTVVCDEGRYGRAVQRLADAGLNAAQIEAGARAIATESLALVQGPPGTGKTRLLAQVVAALCQYGCRVALCAFTHRAVDNALLALRRAAPTLPLAKVGSTVGDSEQELRQAGVARLDPRRSKLPEKGAVIAGTCFQLAKLPDRERFHYTVFDEAGQLPIPHALPGMLRAQRWLFFGDHQQLPPVVTGTHADREAAASIFEHLHRRYGSVLLDTTYRMNDGVCRVVSETFYGGRVVSAAQAAPRRMPFRSGGRLDEVLQPEHAVTWLRVDHRQPGSRSPEEAHAVADVVEDLIRQHGLPATEIAVITPFRAQARLIRSALQHKALSIDGLVVDTVERIQGQEREVVVVSLAVGDVEGTRGSTFHLSENRLNVALSRARSKVVVVASVQAFSMLPMDAVALRMASRCQDLRARLHEVDLSRLYLGAGVPVASR